MPQPVILDPVVDGCPVVFLSDSADDLELVMCLFYDNFKQVIVFPLSEPLIITTQGTPPGFVTQNLQYGRLHALSSRGSCPSYREEVPN